MGDRSGEHGGGGGYRLRHLVATSASPFSWREIVVNIWIEFRRHVLPWLLAGAVIGLMSYQENKRTARMNELLLRQAQSLESVHILLSTQGYLVPPMQEPRSVFEDFGSP